MNVLAEYALLKQKSRECESKQPEIEKQIIELFEGNALLGDKIKDYVLDAAADVERLGPSLLKQAKAFGLPHSSLDELFAPVSTPALAASVDAYLAFFKNNKAVHKFAVAYAICKCAAQSGKSLLSSAERKLTDILQLTESRGWPASTIKLIHQQKKRFDEFSALVNERESNSYELEKLVDESTSIATELAKLKSRMDKLEPKVQAYKKDLQKYSDGNIFRANAGAQELARRLEENRTKKLADVESELENLETRYDNLLVPAYSEGRLRRAYDMLQSFMQQDGGRYKDIYVAREKLLAACKNNNPEQEVSKFKNIMGKLSYALGKSGASEMLATIKRMDELTISCLEEKMRLGPQIINLREKRDNLAGSSFYRHRKV